MTSPVEEITVECPKCWTIYEDWYRGSINASLDPELAADTDYLEAASSATCPACGHKVTIGTLVADMDGVLRFEVYPPT